jgi:hypothetical protein
MKRPFRLEIVLATDGVADRSADRQKVLHAIEAALTKARMDAEAIEYPALTYFIDIAIAELKMTRGPINNFSATTGKKE